jgi:hypothetical protein
MLSVGGSGMKSVGCLGLAALSLMAVANTALAAEPAMDMRKSIVEVPIKKVIAPLPAVETLNEAVVCVKNGVEKVQPGKVHWHKDMAAATEAAKKSGKPILFFAMLGNLDDKFCWTNARLARAVLFSDQKIANYIDEQFEPAWQALRPVPKVSIDFGNGQVINRTLHGNIATFVCAPDGTVVDVIAGMNSSVKYLHELHVMNDVVANLPADQNARRKYLRDYYQRQTAAENAALQEMPIRAARMSAQEYDDFNNATVRRLQIHGKLMSTPIALKPQDMTKWLYSKVLHADLDDPYLGLKDTLFATYPFQENRSSL